MATIATQRTATEDDLLRCPKDGRRYELVDGEIVAMSPAGLRHGAIAIELSTLLNAVVRRDGLGRCFDGQTGFRLPSGNVRSPDIAFVQAARLPTGFMDDGFGEVVPDLAVEIVSPTDTERDVLGKVGEYLEAGVRLVWIVDPRRERAIVYRALTDVRSLSVDEELDGEDVVPGFRARLREVLG